MSVAGFWCLGFLVFGVVFEMIKLVLRPLTYYDGNSMILEAATEWLEETLQTISVASFLAMPLAAVYGFYLLGAWVWSFLP